MAEQNFEVLAHPSPDFDIDFIEDDRIVDGHKQYLVNWSRNWINETDLNHARTSIPGYQGMRRRDECVSFSTKGQRKRRPEPPYEKEIVVPAKKPINRPARIHHFLKKASKQKEYTCMECEKKFNKKFNLHRHVKERHRIRTKETCPRCCKTFARKWSLSVHVKNKTCLDV